MWMVQPLVLKRTFYECDGLDMSSDVVGVKQVPKSLCAHVAVLDRDALEEYRRHQYVEGGVRTAKLAEVVMRHITRYFQP